MDFNDPFHLQITDVIPDGGSKVMRDDAYATIIWHRIGDEYVEEAFFYDLQTVIDANAEEAANFNATGKLGTNVKLASIPTSLWYAWEQEGITQDEAAMARRLNDPDYAKLRTNNLRL